MRNDPDRVIRGFFRIKRGDFPPYRSWSENITRLQLPDLFKQLGYTRGAEIGVASGKFSELLCQGIPGLKLMSVDPWTRYERTSQKLCDWRYAHAVRALTPYGVEIKRMASVDAAKEVPDGSLDFVYIDGNHDFDHVMMDIISWAPKVRVGGVVSGHDYYHFYRGGIIRAVDAYTLAHGITAVYLTNEKESSWMWVKR